MRFSKRLPATVALLVMASVIFSLPQPESKSATITVVGEGRVDVVPDIATVRIGVESFAQDVGKALADSRTTIQAITSSLIELGIDSKDMQTANYSFNFDRSSFGDIGGGRTTYRVNNVLTVTIRNLSLTGSIIDASVLSGANQMWGVEFGVQNPEPVYLQASEKAMEAALERATYLAGLAGLFVGPLVILEELNPSYNNEGRTISSGGGVSPGTISYAVRVTATFALIAEDN